MSTTRGATFRVLLVILALGAIAHGCTIGLPGAPPGPPPTTAPRDTYLGVGK